MRTSARSRALCACGLMAVCFTGFSFRLVQVQVGQHGHYAAIAADKHTDTVTISARRGSIFDAHGEPLAQNEPLRTIAADASLIKDREALIPVLAGPLRMAEAELREKLSRTVFLKAQGKRVPAQRILLQRRVPESVATGIAQAMKEKNLRGIVFEEDSARVYANDRLACHVVGYLSGDDRGVAGIEQSCNGLLRGQDGFRFIERDGTGRELVQYRGQERAPRNGNNVHLTLDMGLQNIVETELEKACKVFRPKGATVILMEPRSGRVLALANRPNFSLNDLDKGTLEQRRNRAIADLYEPGSTFKIVTTAAALNQQIVNPRTMIFCENGYYSAYKLRDHAPYRYLTVNDVLVHSSNIGMAKLAIQTGDQKFYEYVRRFGFGEPTGINLPAEERGEVHPPHAWDYLTETRMAMGHAISTTPLQVIAAMSVIANGGKLMMPQIVKEVTDQRGAVVATYPPQEVRTVVSKKVTDAIRDAMLEVVTPKGTAAGARVFGYKVAGKTGTAQKTQKTEGRNHYSHDKYVVSFVGFMPADDPAFVMIVVFDEARTSEGKNYGGLVAAPVFSNIAERAARYLGLPATEDKPQGEKTGVTFAQKEASFRDQ